MASIFDIKGTSLNSFQIGKDGPTLTRNVNDLELNGSRILTVANPGSGGGSSSTLATLTDATITSPTESQILTYNGISNKWENRVQSNSHPGYRSGLYYYFFR